MRWTVQRTGFAPIKGTRHRALEEIRLAAGGPVGDRRFCLVDPQRGRALRTVEHPELVAIEAVWQEPLLSGHFPDGAAVSGTAVASPQRTSFDYWGREVTGRVVEGPWAAAFGSRLGLELILVECEPGDVVFGDSVTLITTSSLRALSRLLGDGTIDPARLRATVVIDDLDGPDLHSPDLDRPDLDAADLTPADLTDPREAGWVGRAVRLGEAVVRITAPVARCAVIDIHPVTGVRDGRLLKTLGTSARRDATFGDPIFGVQGQVATPGRVRPGDPVSLLD